MTRKWLARMHVRLLLLVVLAALPSLGIIANADLVQRQEALAASGRLALLSAEQLAMRYQDMIRHAHEVLNGVARAPEVRTFRNESECHDWLARVATLNPLYGDLFVAAPDGKLVCRSQPFATAINIADRSYFRRAVASRAFAVGDYSFSRVTGKPVVVFALPVLDERGVVVAVVGLGAPPVAFERMLRKTSLPGNSVITVVDSEGIILARWPDPDGIAGNAIPELAEFKTAIRDANALTVESVWLDGVTRTTAIVPIMRSADDLYVRVGIPTAVAQAAANAVVRRNLILLGGASLLVILFGWFSARHLVLRRVQDLAETARRLGSGDLRARCSLPPDEGELGDLARGLNEMAGHIQDAMAKLQAADEEVRLRDRAIQSSRNGILIYRYGSPAGIVCTNPALLTLLAAGGANLVGASLSSVAAWGFDHEGWEQLLALLFAQREGEIALSLSRGAQEVVWLEAGVTLVKGGEHGFSHAVIELRDITERHHYVKQLAYQANHDELTGLPNRNLLNDRLEQALAHAAHNSGCVHVLWLDVDRFHVVHDSFGRRVADRTLVAISRRIMAIASECGTIARLAHDEFVLVSEPVIGQQGVISLANRVLETLRQPIVVDGREFCLTVSVGIAESSGPEQDVDSLLRNANIAALRAKAMGRDTFCLYSSTMNERAADKLRLEIELRRAIERNELFLVYQPKVDLLTGEIVGSEALCRWRHAELGAVPPSEFIAVAERSGLILAVGRWVLETACAQMRAWLDTGIDCRRMAVNVSALQFYRDDLVSDISALLGRYRLDPHSLMLEITESTLMGDPERAIATMQRLKALEVKLAIDDFGTGYSSLSTLQRFPIDYLKIDRAFISDLTTSASNAAIAVSIISLAHSLNLRVIAEGVETEGQLLYLRGRACDEMQGYFYAPPVSPEHLSTMIAERQWLEFPVQKDLPERTLLLVDDEPSVRSALRRLLRREGYTLLFAGDAAEAFDLLARHAVGVVISDYRMPGMDGIRFLDKVRGLYPETVRMVLSGYSNVNVITEAINRGAVFRYLHKPWNDRELMESVRDAFERFEVRVVAQAA
ncbi:EAL domain-containing protein [Aromatoleum petrolei]|uniref:EAL domain-containing protein n=1 Tax=Aromatoleum petrolei TaxID=76116 RepID=A0ABX1MQ15_9RHOO|nr:EAL domain-containing protein [Aromatoleum petrolei]NMF88214.1 EAL domain-containing protein [Aromatoleum petrolei]QTQ38926.1 Diguanylate cyclase/phosphodiesterase, PAS domain-containing [Aromatoleum petrolei]